MARIANPPRALRRMRSQACCHFLLIGLRILAFVFLVLVLFLFRLLFGNANSLVPAAFPKACGPEGAAPPYNYVVYILTRGEARQTPLAGNRQRRRRYCRRSCRRYKPASCMESYRSRPVAEPALECCPIVVSRGTADLLLGVIVLAPTKKMAAVFGPFPDPVSGFDLEMEVEVELWR